MELGILTEGINEVIATTAGACRKDESRGESESTTTTNTGNDALPLRPNAAPMGIFCRKGRIRMRVYRGTHTEENMRRNGWVVANVTHDPVVFVETAFGDIGADRFTEITHEGTTFWRLKDCEAWAAFRCTVLHVSEDLSVFELHPVAEEIISCEVHPHNRGFSSVIDATILGTRYVMFNDPAMLEKIRYHRDIALKCGSERERIAIKKLDEVIGISVD
ncbi:MAG TPA: DUF447 family protein [Methanoculleus sp.]|nr:DUF447 family protein [Methanoculleus sp.]